ncbi:glycosyltransferase [Magnetospirillum sp. SS-4]|uniref:glycosyltransferase family protein n=1 Tax=Magnetospirillum sp. SS-4 TaxID=2681465 RepID=UPI00157470CB|nr:glycosyltransferase [Magnetospirillum sp. SS-4]
MSSVRTMIDRMAADGNLAGACEVADQNVVDNPDRPEAFFLAADIHARMGRFAEAGSMIRHGRRLGGEFPRDMSNDFNNVWVVSPIDFEYSEILCRPSSYLGTWTGGDLGEVRRAVLRSLLDTHWEAWQRGEVAMPSRASVLDGGIAGPVPARRPRVLVAMPEYINCSPLFIRNDISLHFAASAARLGLEVRFFATDACAEDGKGMVRSREAAAECRRELGRLVAAFQPEIVVIDGNVIPEDKAISRDEWGALKQAHGFKILAVVPDSYDTPELFTADGKLTYWSDCADLINTYHCHGYEFMTFPNRDMLLATPSLPFDAGMFDGPPVEKDQSYFLVGTNSRYRLTLLNAARSSGLDGIGLIHDRRADQVPSYDAYVEAIKRSKTTINNGRVSENNYIITGRVTEAILARSVVLEDAGSPLDDYYVPFVHYMPFSTYHELIFLIQFFEAEPERRDRMTGAAHAFWSGHYSSGRFWSQVLARLG